MRKTNVVQMHAYTRKPFKRSTYDPQKWGQARGGPRNFQIVDIGDAAIGGRYGRFKSVLDKMQYLMLSDPNIGWLGLWHIKQGRYIAEIRRATEIVAGTRHVTIKVIFFARISL